MKKRLSTEQFVLLIPLIVIAVVSLFFAIMVIFDSLSIKPELLTPQPTLVSIGITASPTPSAESSNLIVTEPVSSTVPTIADNNSITYSVKAGDTIYGLAIDFGSSIEAIIAANSLNGDLIYPGQVLIIPGDWSTIPVEVSDTTPITATSFYTETGVFSNVYIVVAGDTLEGIANVHKVAIEDLRATNFMFGDTLLVGQRLIIPLEGQIASPAWHFSVLERDPYFAYPLELEVDRFSLHYTPDSYPAIDPEALAMLVERGIAQIEATMQDRLDGNFDVFTAGTIFSPPNQALRGCSFSYARQSLILHDGTGNAADQQYIIAHELTHLFSWNVFGQPVSPMLSEGAAVYMGMQAISDSNHVPLDQFCLAYQLAGQLPRVSTSLSFQGHIYDLENYYAAGCFVGYLIETYGPQAFGQLYPKGNFEIVYGKSISILEEEWRTQLKMNNGPDGDYAAQLVLAVEEIENAYQDFFPRFTGTTRQIVAYQELDKARIALLEGRLDDMHEYLVSFHQSISGN